MITINKYINEKLVINKDTKMDETNVYVHPDDSNAPNICATFKSRYDMYDGRVNAGKIKLMLSYDDKHFYIKPNSAKKYHEPLPAKATIFNYFFRELTELGLGDSYVIDAYENRIDNTSRINNLKITYHHFYFGDLGMIFKNKKEANIILKDAKQNYNLSGSFKYKIITIEEASKMKSTMYGDDIGDIKFIQYTK